MGDNGMPPAPGWRKCTALPLAGRWWYAVGTPLERGVRRRAPNEAPGERGVQEVPRELYEMSHGARINLARAVERR